MAGLAPFGRDDQPLVDVKIVGGKLNSQMTPGRLSTSFFFRVEHTLYHRADKKRKKKHHTLFSRQLYFHRVVHMDPCLLHAYFFSFPRY